MIEPSLSPDEPLRLQALRDTNQLDTPLEERFERITRLAQRLLRAPIAAISLVDADRQWFKSIQGLDVSETSRAVAFCSHTILKDDPMVVPDARVDPRCADNPLVTKDPQIVFYAGCPIRARDGSKVGSLCVIDLTARTIGDDDLQILRDLAAIAEREMASAMEEGAQRELIDQVDEVRRQAQVDTLTRIWNRTSIFGLLHAEIARAQRADRAVGLIMADLDHFKRINDTHGHPIGDEVLRQAAKKMLSAIREVDSLGRYGGEEFMIVLGECDGMDGAKFVAERIRQRIAERPFVTEVGEIPVTLSLGLTYRESKTGVDDQALVRAADEALYRAKRRGRNCVEAAVFVPSTEVFAATA